MILASGPPVQYFPSSSSRLGILNFETLQRRIERAVQTHVGFYTDMHVLGENLLDLCTIVIYIYQMNSYAQRTAATLPQYDYQYRKIVLFHTTANDEISVDLAVDGLVDRRLSGV